MDTSILEELKSEAKDLGITFSANIGANKLQTKINDYYESQETSGKAIEEMVNKTEKVKPEKVSKANLRALEVAAAKKAANKTRVVTVVDNDKRVNSEVETFKVNCSNSIFDLGTVILPLNMPVEIRVGHLNVLKEVKIPHHVKDPVLKTSSYRMIKRYNISYEDIVT